MEPVRAGILVNVIKGFNPALTTYRLAADCAAAGHEVWVMSPSGLSYGPGDRVRARAYAFDDVANPREIVLDELDVLLLRNNPPAQTDWAREAGIQFGRLAARRGVLVLNDPDGLSRASSKIYLESLPEAVRPRTLITRSRKEIARFLEEEERVVLKPLRGYGGTNVFLARKGDAHNLAQIVKAVGRDGYVMAQEYLPAAEKGDLRLFLLNGKPCRQDGKYAAVRRARTSEDLRSNVHAGGEPCRAKVDDAALHVAEAVRPRLVEDGMFLVGLDIVGDKLMEVNVFSPGGLRDASRLEKTPFVRSVREALERKVEHVRACGRRFRNAEVATL